MTSNGVILSLFSTECGELLHRAMHVAEQQAKETRTWEGQQDTLSSVHRYVALPNNKLRQQQQQQQQQQQDVVSSSEDEEGEGESNPTVVSDDDDDDDEQRETSLEEKDDNANEGGEESEETRKKQLLQRQEVKQRLPPPDARVIQRHVASLTVSSFPLSNHNHRQKASSSSSSSSKEEKELCVPTALLSKEARLSGDAVAMLREFTSMVATTATTTTATTVVRRRRPWVVLCLRSGKFAGAVFSSLVNGSDESRGSGSGAAVVCTHHRTLQRYTVRKGQGKAQSSRDQAAGKAVSVGAQLRRAGEQALQRDLKATLVEWREAVRDAALILISCPKNMRKYLFDAFPNDLLDRTDPRLRRVPLDLGRPTFENAVLIYQVLTYATVRQVDAPAVSTAAVAVSAEMESSKEDNQEVAASAKAPAEIFPAVEVVPMSALHVAAKNGDLQVLQDILASMDGKADGDNAQGNALVDEMAGEDSMTPLHLAAAATANSTNVAPAAAAACVKELLLTGRADPTLRDERGRVAYFLAAHATVRDAFRVARAQLGEDYCQWTEDAKVGPPLTADDLTARQEKEAEKKRQKRSRQKDKKAKENAQRLQLEEQQRQQEEQAKQEAEAKRMRDGLNPNKPKAANACDFCQKSCRLRKNMFFRLDYAYCTNECVQKHKRELMATAALARFDK